jgi:hypothetical protein
MGPISKMLSFLLEPAVSATNVDTNHSQPDELQAIATMPIDNAIFTNVLTETMEGKELQPYSVSSSPQRTTMDSPATKAKRPTKLIILSTFLTRLVSSLMLLFSRKPVQGTENETKTAIHWAKQLFMKDLVEKQASTPLLTAPQTVEKPKELPPWPQLEEFGNAFCFQLRQQLVHWKKGGNTLNPQEMIWTTAIAKIYNEAWRTSLPLEEAMVLTSFDFKTIVATIKTLRNKVGIAELAVAILLALVVDNKLYKQSGCRSASEFFVRYSEAMGISASRARDYCKRGVTFLDYRNDFLEGVGSIPGIPIEEFASSYMSKLTIYDAAVRKFGREQALYKLKTLSFRDFKEELKVKKPKKEKAPNNAQAHKPSDGSSHVVYNAHEEQKAMIEALNLSPSEKRLLHIIVKNGIAVTIKRLSAEQREQLETRLRKWRVEYFERQLPCNSSLFERKSYDPANPLAISDDLYKLTNINDICLRIKAGLALIVPARRTIAILLHRLNIELPHSYKHPRPGVEYASFRDFAMEELGMGEEYRDYIAIGKVISNLPDILYWLSDVDTEDVFFKLKYLWKALDNHKDKCLVIARLRSLTVREFKLFSEMPDFETTFSKRLTKKQLASFDYDLRCSRNKEMMGQFRDYIEAYSDYEEPWILKFENEVIEEAKAKTLLLSPV